MEGTCDSECTRTVHNRIRYLSADVGMMQKNVQLENILMSSRRKEPVGNGCGEEIWKDSKYLAKPIVLSKIWIMVNEKMKQFIKRLFGKLANLDPNKQSLVTSLFIRN